MAVHDRRVYATHPRTRQRQINELLRQAAPRPSSGDVVAVIVPDANLLSGGKIAANVYSTLRGMHFDTVILVEPSHEGAFGRIHICEKDEYRTTFGDLRVNDSIRNDLCDEDDDIFLDNAGHFHLEGTKVQLPFLQTVLESSFDIVPIVMGNETPDFCRELGHAVGEIMYSRRVLLVATASILDVDEDAANSLREHLEHGDESRLTALLNSAGIRVTGKGPILVSLIAALHRKANEIHVLDIQLPENGRPGAIGAVISRT